jgi:hypothetical protein
VVAKCGTWQSAHGVNIICILYLMLTVGVNMRVHDYGNALKLALFVVACTGRNLD